MSWLAAGAARVGRARSLRASDSRMELWRRSARGARRDAGASSRSRARRGRTSRETFATIACALLAISALADSRWCARGTIRRSTRARPRRFARCADVIGRRQYDVAGTVAAPGADLAAGRELVRVRGLAGRARRVDTESHRRVWRTSITIAFAALGDARRARASAAATREAGAALARAVRVRERAASSSISTSRRARRSAGACSRQRAARGARSRLLLRARLLGVGAWAGIGAVTLARRAGAAWPPIGVWLAALPLVAQLARAADRRAEPEREIAPASRDATLLRPRRATRCSFVGRRQRHLPALVRAAVERIRPDVTVVTLPLLGAQWYRAELARRTTLLSQRDVVPYRGVRGAPRARIASSARAGRRPVAAARSRFRRARVRHSAI